MKRRTFIKVMLAAGAGVLLLPFALRGGTAAPPTSPGRAVRPRGYPGRIAALDDAVVRRMGHWLG